jgi:hypothetical protein
MSDLGVPPIYSSERHGLSQVSILVNVCRLNSGHAMQPLASTRDANRHNVTLT